MAYNKDNKGPRGPQGNKPSGDSPWKNAAPKRAGSKDGPRKPGGPGRGGPSDRPPRERPPHGRQRSEERPAPPPKRVRARRASTPMPYNAPLWLTSTNERSPEVASAPVQEIVDGLGLKLDPALLGKLVDQLFLVREMNEEVNLVSRASVDSVLLQSVWESLVPSTSKEWNRGPRVMDLGTGGGFPGLPMAILHPEMQFTLVDSRRAKTLALRRILQETGLKNVEVVHERAETFSEHVEEPFDTVTVKAVGMLKEVVPWVDSLLRSGGTLLAWKGPEGLREFSELPQDKWKIVGNLPVLPHRTVMVIEKV